LWIALVGLMLVGGFFDVARLDAASVTLTWSAPTTNADGSRLTDLATYRIYLGTSTPACPSASFFTVSSPTASPASGQTMSTGVTSLDAGTTYYTRITAVDASGSESACSVPANGVAKADFSVTPSTSTSFGSVAIGTTVDRAFTVQNTSTTNLSGTASIGAPYSIVSGGSFSLTPGSRQTVTVRFRPTASGAFAANVNFNAGSDSISRAVTGTGTGSSTAPASPSSLPATPSSPAAPSFTAMPNQVVFAYTRGTARPLPQSVVIQGGSGPWTTRDTNPWADVTGYVSFDGTYAYFASSSTTFGVALSNLVSTLNPGTYTQEILVTRGSLSTRVTVRVTVQ
jgi:Cep192 domain 4